MKRAPFYTNHKRVLYNDILGTSHLFVAPLQNIWRSVICKRPNFLLGITVELHTNPPAGLSAYQNLAVLTSTIIRMLLLNVSSIEL